MERSANIRGRSAPINTHPPTTCCQNQRYLCVICLLCATLPPSCLAGVAWGNALLCFLRPIFRSPLNLRLGFTPAVCFAHRRWRPVLDAPASTAITRSACWRYSGLCDLHSDAVVASLPKSPPATSLEPPFGGGGLGAQSDPCARRRAPRLTAIFSVFQVPTPRNQWKIANPPPEWCALCAQSATPPV